MVQPDDDAEEEEEEQPTKSAAVRENPSLIASAPSLHISIAWESFIANIFAQTGVSKPSSSASSKSKKKGKKGKKKPATPSEKKKKNSEDIDELIQKYAGSISTWCLSLHLSPFFSFFYAPSLVVFCLCTIFLFNSF